MSRICFAMSRVIPAAPGQVFHLLDDYEHGHWRVLPPAFSDYRVLAGGFGEGTRIAFSLTTGGRSSATEGVVTVPDPGRVIVETYPNEQMVTTFTVDPAGDGKRVPRPGRVAASQRVEQGEVELSRRRRDYGMDVSPKMRGCQHRVERRLYRAGRVGQKICDAGERLVLLRVKDMEDGSHQ